MFYDTDLCDGYYYLVYGGVSVGLLSDTYLVYCLLFVVYTGSSY